MFAKSKSGLCESCCDTEMQRCAFAFTCRLNKFGQKMNKREASLILQLRYDIFGSTCEQRTNGVEVNANSQKSEYGRTIERS